MSWFRSAVNKAVEVGGKNNISRIRNYADTVVQQAGQAVAEGAKIFQDRIGARNLKSFKFTVRRLEEAAISCRGVERIQLLRRWLLALKEIERFSSEAPDDKDKNLDSNDSKDSPKRPSQVLYYDSELGGEPMNFRDVFLYSHALEGLTLSMILEEPNDEEVTLLMEIFGQCLTGGRDVHNAIVSSIQDLARAFTSYEDEVLVKREELLQFAQGAISGLKKNADLARIDAEVSTLQQKLVGMKASQVPSNNEGQGETSDKTTISTVEALRGALAEVRHCSRLEALLLKKKSLNNGDSPEIHSQKIDKLRVLSDSLANSTSKAEKRITDHRHQREEALKFRVAKASEVGETEKELASEISALEKQKEEVEAELKRVNASLTAALGRLHNAREEREHFEEASSKIVAHLNTKEDELSKSIGSCRVEADVVKTWVNFLEDTWILQSKYIEEKDKQANEELENHREYFVNLVIHHLSAYKEELGPYITRIRKFVENLEKLREGSKSEMKSGVDSEEIHPRKDLEEEYLDYEEKIITTFSVVDNMKQQFYSVQGKVSGKEDDPRVKELYDWMEKMREEFERIERPSLEIEIAPVQTIETLVSKKEASSAEVAKKDEKAESSSVALDTEAELAKLESEFGEVSREYSKDEEIGEWEFDELEKELKSGDRESADKK